MDSEFYVYMDKKGIEYGVFINNSSGDDLYFNKNLPNNRKEIIKLLKITELIKPLAFTHLLKTQSC